MHLFNGKNTLFSEVPNKKNKKKQKRELLHVSQETFKVTKKTYEKNNKYTISFLDFFSWKTNKSETTENILQELDQDGDKTVDFSEFILLIFGLTKAYYTCIKSILCPELEEREKRTESQEQQSTELEYSQLQKEKFLGREFQESER